MSYVEYQVLCDSVLNNYIVIVNPTDFTILYQSIKFNAYPVFYDVSLIMDIDFSLCETTQSEHGQENRDIKIQHK